MLLAKYPIEGTLMKNFCAKGRLNTKLGRMKTHPKGSRLPGKTMAEKVYPIILCVVCLLSLLCCLACGASDESSSSSDTDDDALNDDLTDDDLDDDDSDDDGSPCDESFLPIVFVHGILENGDAFSTQTMRFASNGYCIDRIFCHDWNAMNGVGDEPARLADTIDFVLTETGAAQVDLIVHSVGAGLGMEYLLREDGAQKVAHYAQIAALPCLEIPDGASALNISSEDDAAVGVCELEGSENLILQDIDHLETASSAPIFEALFRFFNDEAPQTTEIVPREPIELSGHAVVFGMNAPVEGVEIQIYECDPLTGERLHANPGGVFFTDEEGRWGVFDAAPGAYYEFTCLDPAGFWPPMHYYREPFKRSNNKVYFRVYPKTGSALGLLFGALPLDDAFASFSWMNVNQAVLSGRDELSVNGIDLATPAIADPALTTLVIVFGDVNGNGLSDEIPLGGALAEIDFVRFFDLLIATEQFAPIQFTFNGRIMAVPNWMARSQGLSVAVFE
jgi:triacylglycerol lipase